MVSLQEGMGNAFRPETLVDALRMLAAQPLLPMAGGTDLMVRHRPAGGTVARFPLPVLMVGHLPELRGIRPCRDGLEIGAACTLTEYLDSPLVPEGWKPPVAGMASPAIRNIGTIGGNVVNASPAGDTLPMWQALDAEVVLASKDGTRTMPLADFITGPGRTERGPGELMTALRVPMPDPKRTYWYRKVGPRQANCLSKVSLFGWWTCGHGVLTACGVALGAVAPVVVRSREAEALLAGTPLPWLGPNGSHGSHGSKGRNGPCGTYGPEEGGHVRESFLRVMDAHIRPIDDQRSTAVYRREVAWRLMAEWLDGIGP